MYHIYVPLGKLFKFRRFYSILLFHLVLRLHLAKETSYRNSNWLKLIFDVLTKFCSRFFRKYKLPSS